VRTTVLVPAKNSDAITESGKPLAKSPGVRFLRMEGGRAVLDVESGGATSLGRWRNSGCIRSFCKDSLVRATNTVERQARICLENFKKRSSNAGFRTTAARS
jgi:hypothetical protein